MNCINVRTLLIAVSTIDTLEAVSDLAKLGVPSFLNRAIMIVQKKIHK